MHGTKYLWTACFKLKNMQYRISIISIDKNCSYFSKLFEKQRRCKELESKKLLFVGSGVSGGEDGARYGPSLMPGGSDAAWYVVHNIWNELIKHVMSHLLETFTLHKSSSIMLWQRANTCNISSRNSLQWLIYIIDSVVKNKLSCNIPPGDKEPQFFRNLPA